MATFDQAGSVNGGVDKRNFANTANWAGAVVSLALMAGVAVWGYRLIVRDVSGVPIVEATQGPMRVAPDNPGGLAADHQGLSVNGVAGTGTAAAPADTLRLAPRAQELAGEDVPQGNIVPASTAPEREQMTATSLSRDDIADPPPTPANRAPVAAPPSDDPVQALADQIAAGIKPLFDGTTLTPDSPPVVTSLSAAPDATPPAVVSAPQDGLARSLRPKTRPAALRTASLAPPVAADASTAEIDPKTLPNGTRLVQLGAYESADVARSEWARLETKFGDYLDGKSRVIQRASSGGRVFYRLRAHGFADISDARRFCSAFVSENADCIPVVSR